MADVTIRDVASEAGLSVSSVSRILRGGQGHVFPTSTHDRVREIADRLGYRANVAARLLRQTTRTLIGISTHLTEHPHLNRFVVGLRVELIKHGYDPVIMDSDQLSGASSGEAFPPLHMLAGLINLGTDLDHGCPEHYAAIRKTIPVVAIQAVSPAAAEWIDVIHVDFASAYGQAIQHLADLGHQRIAYFGPVDGATPIDASKFKGWKAAAKKAGINGRCVIPWRVTGWREPPEMDDWMSQAKIQRAVAAGAERWRKSTPRPTAIVCASDEVAICLQSYLLEKGFQLPRDLSIIGYDGISVSAFAFPALTTVAPDYQRMAEAAILRLLHLVERGKGNGDEKPQEVFITPHIIVRSSTAAPSTPAK